MEELFEDGGTGDPKMEGTIRSGTYIVKVRLAQDIPEFLPVAGKRIIITQDNTEVNTVCKCECEI